MANFPAGVTFPANAPVAKPRDIPAGAIKQTAFTVEKDSAGNFVFAIRLTIPGGVVHPNAFAIDDTTFQNMCYFPLTDVAHGVLSFNNLTHALSQTNNIVTVNLNFDVVNGKIGGAGL